MQKVNNFNYQEGNLLKLEEEQIISQLHSDLGLNYLSQTLIYNPYNIEELPNYSKFTSKISIDFFQEIGCEANNNESYKNFKQPNASVLVKQKRKYNKKNKNNHLTNQTIHIKTLEKCTSYIQQNVCIRTTPIQQLKKYIKNDQYLRQQISETDLKQFCKVVEKRKLILKRERAKLRQAQAQNNLNIKDEPTLKVTSIKDESDGYSVDGNEYGYSSVFGKEEKKEGRREDKMKRNRISAQVSRDRRKMYTYELQKNNTKLKQDYENILLQNQRLKRQLLKYKRQSETQPKNEDSRVKLEQESLTTLSSKGVKDTVQNNKFVKLLVLLGLIFFITLIKDSLFSKDLRNQNQNQQLGIISEKEEMELQMEKYISPSPEPHQFLILTKKQQQTIVQKTNDLLLQKEFILRGPDQKRECNQQTERYNFWNTFSTIISQKIPSFNHGLVLPKQLGQKFKCISEIL